MGGYILDKSVKYTLGVGGLERRHSSTEGGSFRGEPVVKITVNRRHSLPSEGSTRGGSLSNGAVTIELVSSGSGESAGRDSSPESTEVLPFIYNWVEIQEC